MSVVPKIRVEPWAIEYGSSNQIDEAEEPVELATIPEGEPFGFVPLGPAPHIRLAFLDGVQRLEAHLVQLVEDRVTPGLACAYAVGAVIAEPNRRPEFINMSARRIVIWTAGIVGLLPAVPGGWHWDEQSTADTGPDAAVQKLNMLRQEDEAALAHLLENEDLWVVCDGTHRSLFSPRRDGTNRNIAGCVKSHHKQLLPEPYASELRNLPAGHRTTLFTKPSNKLHSCYLRLGDPQPWESPLAGIARLEFSSGFELPKARAVADTFASNLLKFAGIPHVDPRAPQNLQPIGALEAQLRRLLGDKTLARRAIHEAVYAGEPT